MEYNKKKSLTKCGYYPMERFVAMVVRGRTAGANGSRDFSDLHRWIVGTEGADLRYFTKEESETRGLHRQHPRLKDAPSQLSFRPLGGSKERRKFS